MHTKRKTNSAENIYLLTNHESHLNLQIERIGSDVCQRWKAITQSFQIHSHIQTCSYS